MGDTNQMNTKEQIDLIQFDDLNKAVYKTSILCSYLGINSVCIQSLGSCNQCIGNISIRELEAIEPELTKDNIEDTIKIWRVLLE